MINNKFKEIRPKILVIDDNKDTTEMLEDFFEIKDIECKVINEGKEGLNELYKDDVHYNCVLLDLTMPGFSGLDIFKKIQGKNILKSKNIIIFTASVKSLKEIDDLINQGARYVLKKPCSIHKILEIVEKFLS